MYANNWTGLWFLYMADSKEDISDTEQLPAVR